MNLFKKKCICGMKEESGKGIEREGRWFCCESCLIEYKNGEKKQGGCCCC